MPDYRDYRYHHPLAHVKASTAAAGLTLRAVKSIENHRADRGHQNKPYNTDTLPQTEDPGKTLAAHRDILF